MSATTDLPLPAYTEETREVVATDQVNRVLVMWELDEEGHYELPPLLVITVVFAIPSFLRLLLPLISPEVPAITIILIIVIINIIAIIIVIPIIIVVTDFDSDLFS